MNFGPQTGNPLFYVGNIPVRVNPMFVIVSLLWSRSGSVEEAVTWLVIVFLSVLVHELGHALLIIRYGGEPAIELHAMGGTTSWSRRLALTHWQNIWVSLAGPFAGFAFGALFYGMARIVPPTNDWMRATLGMAYWVNFGWGIFNLIPIVPLDGGHVMRSLVAIRWPKRAEAIADVITVIFATAVISLALLNEMMFTVLIVAFFTLPSFLRMKPHVERMVDALTFSAASDFITACVTKPEMPDVAKAERIVAGARTASGRRAAAEALLWALLDRRDVPRVAAVGDQYFRGQLLSPAVESRIDTAFDRTSGAIARLEHGGTVGNGDKELYAYVEACIAAGEEERAAKLLAALRDERVLAVYAERAFSARRYADALAAYELGHQVFERDAAWTLGAARTLAREGRVQEAQVALKEALVRDPTYDVARDPDLAALESTVHESRA